MKCEKKILERLKEQYVRDYMAHGCGYWSVCWEHACPCASTAAVMQGFSLDVWNSLQADSKREAEAVEKEDMEFLHAHGCTFEQYVNNGFKDEPYEDYPWPSEDDEDDHEDDSYSTAQASRCEKCEWKGNCVCDGCRRFSGYEHDDCCDRIEMEKTWQRCTLREADEMENEDD